MRVIVDTSIWSPFLRRKHPISAQNLQVLEQLIREKRIQMLGIIKQELLSGIKEQAQFEKLNDILAGYPDLLADSEDHIVAAQCYNTCRKKGVQGSTVDFLICAQAVNHQLAILTSDKDFQSYAKFLPIRLYSEEVE